MSCTQFEQYELGHCDRETFEQHLKTCTTCQTLMKQDTQMMQLAQSLNEPIAAPQLWTRIEAKLAKETSTEKTARILRIPFSHGSKTLLRLAAVFIIVIGIGIIWRQVSTPDLGNSTLLAESTLQRVEKLEADYVKAIEELERRADSELATMELDLMLLYRDRLETIDAQIERCREALQKNPANAHIRRYMLAALQDKRETLTELLKNES